MGTNVIMKCSQIVGVMYGRHTAVGSTLKEQNKLTIKHTYVSQQKKFYYSYMTILPKHANSMPLVPQYHVALYMHMYYVDLGSCSSRT